MNKFDQAPRKRSIEVVNLDALLHPSSAFRHPRDVLADPDLTTGEKRAILASWASDACAVADAPQLRASVGPPVSFDEVMDALKTLDDQAGDDRHTPRPHYRTVLERRGTLNRGRTRRGDDDAGSGPTPVA